MQWGLHRGLGWILHSFNFNRTGRNSDLTKTKQNYFIGGPTIFQNKFVCHLLDKKRQQSMREAK
jgi:hypothetical protein